LIVRMKSAWLVPCQTKDPKDEQQYADAQERRRGDTTLHIARVRQARVYFPVRSANVAKRRCGMAVTDRAIVKVLTAFGKKELVLKEFSEAV
jgi:hypothetical protein